MSKAVISRISKNLSSLIIAHTIYKAFTFLVMILLARFLDVEGFGRISFGLSFVWIFLFLSDFGFSELLVRDTTFNEKLLAKYTDTMTGLKVFISIVAYFILLITGKLISAGDTIKFLTIVILGVSVILDSFVYYFRAIFRIKNIIRYEAILIGIEACIKLGVIFLAVASRVAIHKIVMVSLAFLLVSLFNFIINLWTFVRYNKVPAFKFDKKIWLYFLQTGFPFAAVYILSLINFRVDVIMLSRIRGDMDAGIFSASLKIIEQFLLLPFVLSYVILPEFLKLARSTKDLYRIAFRLIAVTTLVSIGIIIISFAFSQNLVRIIFGPKFLSASVYCNLLSLILPFFFIKVIGEKILYSYGKQLNVSLIYLTCVFLNIILNLIMIPTLGIYGTCTATLISEIVMMFGIIFYAKRHIPVISSQNRGNLEQGIGFEYLNYNDK